jgi:type VI protein secretion system component VasK
MKVLAGDPSPYQELFKGVWEAQQLRLSDTDVPVPPDLKPLGAARDALFEFQTQIEEFVATTQAGNRVAGSMKEGKLQPFLDQFKKVNRDLTKAVLSAPSGNQQRLKDVMYQAIDNTRAALAKEAQKEANDMWNTTVAKLFKEGIEGRYPFDEAAAAGSTRSPASSGTRSTT